MPSSPNDTELSWNNYKIPKANPQSGSPAMAWKGAKGSFANQALATPLADSYYNYPYDPNAAGAYYHNQQPGFHYGNQTGYNEEGVKITAAGPVAPGGNFHQKVLDALQHREKPKNVTKNVFHEIVPDLQDDSLPKDLKVLFQPLFCKLCSAKLTSNMTAKMHYKSKNHEKKIKKWLVDYAEKSGEPLHPRAQASGDKGSESDPNWFHCQVCDLQLTGRLHAESHYMGRNHQRAVLGHKTPAGQGYYDTSGNWVRIKSTKSKSMNFEGGEDNFGTQFKRKLDEEPSGPPVKKKNSQSAEQFRCDVCGIKTTCNEQLQSHYIGQKHAKKLKSLSLAATTDPSIALGLSQMGVIVPPQNQVMAVPIAVPTVADLTGDLSVYRTPSGSYYCPACNLSTNSEPQYRQHLTSKNHAKKALQANITEKYLPSPFDKH